MYILYYICIEITVFNNILNQFKHSNTCEPNLIKLCVEHGYYEKKKTIQFCFSL